MKYTVDIHGEINEQLIDDVVLKLRSIYDYNEYQLDTFVSPMELYEEIELDIDTPGGLVTGFMQIRKEVDKLKNQGVEVNTFVSGTAYSCGFLLTLLGTKRDSDELGSFLYHRGGCQLGYDKVDSNARFLEHQKTILDKVDNFIIENTNIEEETLLKYRDIDWYLNKDEAIELGILTDPNKKPELPTITLEQCIESYETAGYKVIKEEIKDKSKKAKKKAE